MRVLRHFGLLLTVCILMSTRYEIDAQTGIKAGLVADIAYSPDGSKIAVAAGAMNCGSVANHVIKIIDSTTQNELRSLEGHDCSILSVAWNPDGTQLASAGQDSTIRIWDVATGQSTSIIEDGVSPDGWYSLEWSPDGSMLVSLFGSLWINVWDTSTEQYLFNLKGHEYPVRDVEWSPDGRQLVSGSSDHTVRIWDVETRTTTMTLAGHRASVIAVGWSPDGSKIASGGTDSTVRIWEAATGRLLNVVDTAGPLLALSWNADSDMLATADAEGHVQIIRLLPELTIDTIPTDLGALLDVEWNPVDSNELIYFGMGTGLNSDGLQGPLFERLIVNN